MATLEAGADFSVSRRMKDERLAKLQFLIKSSVLVLTGPVCLLVLWWAASANSWVSPQVLPRPDWVFNTFLDLLADGDIFSAAIVSFQRIAEGFLIGASLGLAFGFLIGKSKIVEAYLGPSFRALAAVPSLGWLPILILLFGIEESVKIIILSKACFVPMAISTAEGARDIPKGFNEVADILGLRARTRFFKLTIPAMAPYIASGVRLSLSQAFVSLIVVEMLAGTDGLGYMMVWGRTLFQLDIVIVGMIVVGVVGFALDLLLKRAEALMRKGSHV
ncbi:MULTISPECIES: ABC transporter permease [Brucella/Ochrobactrum group]|uniref:ABC transporter permease n=1 Tax=Brucella/Ochrobactrum group TaxID=2826938 RepID=UPI000F5E8BFD|nr:ABC transporter permease [Brucella sp. NM4]MCI1001579.1 ABC transporter permease [Ochrobactrum sp. C6C9]RRD26467.1 ABC transporter permease [Brucellaceae bacterium VT-16-1752]WHS29625.1 ABC transporter permease [Brucella sp. NM4]WHT44897.1 ABC transporter permease [Ochrobactrum sp. SSR]